MSLLHFIKRVVRSRLGQILFVVHLCLVVYDFAPKPAASGDMPCVVEPSSQALIAARPFHYHYESDLMKTLIVLDLPGLVLGYVIDLLLTPLNYLIRPCAYARSWMAAGVCLVGTSIQWWLVGFLVGTSIRYRKPRQDDSTRGDT